MSVKWLYLDLNSFFASCEQQERPELRGKPVAVVPLMADTTFCIAASYPAKKFGVKTGTRVDEAKRLCPGLQLVLARHKVYVEYHHRILQAVDAAIPIDSVRSIDEICCQLTGTQTNVEVARGVALRVKESLRTRLGEAMTGSIGISTNRYLAKIAADMKKPDGLTVLEKKDLPHALLPLKLSDLPGVGRKIEARLYAKGITTMEQLLSKSEVEMQGLWGGIWGNRLYKWVRGEELELPPTRSHSLSHQHVLPPVQRNANDAKAVIRRLLVKAAVRLRREKYFTKSLGVNVKWLGPAPSWEASLRFAETQDTVKLIEALDQLLVHMPAHKPLRVGVVLGGFVPADQHQLSLFEAPRRDSLMATVDSINERYGKDAVHFGAIHDHLGTGTTKIAFQRIPELDELEE